ncbi:pyridoxamine 5'-phosphate oxidase family protein [Novosphingobium lentum]|uniref:pyridoxamine 5'-phosphate oxidase family protein n=1 Tax=Novosphingobium lentum TaxID=145287 RepID=UPI0008350D44|nr:pyridoxamine 5'-phosphate oxidase family protein [Novosphingobium lentum]
MKYSDGQPAEMKEKFWKAMTHSPFVMLQLDHDPDSAAPMTAQLDKDADSAIWFFTSKDGRYASGGAATANFESKGHDVFARFAGTLVEETDRARLDKQWNNFVEAWYPGGKTDPNLLFLRMDLGDASIWSGDMGLLATAKMALGMSVREDASGQYVETAL